MLTRCIVRRVACFAAATNTLIAHRTPRHSPAKRYLNNVSSSSSAVDTNWKPPVIDWTTPRDLLVRAKTGSEKNSAFIIPAVVSLLDHVKKRTANNVESKSTPSHSYRHRPVGPLILAPTRESAVQIASDAQKLTMHRRGFEVQLLAGGADKDLQKKDWMESSRDLVVATPGRLRDLLTNHPEFRQGFKGCPMLILDEADTLLSAGFRDDINVIVSFLPRAPLRQTVLFTATTPRAVRQLASWVLSPDHIFVDATTPEIDSAQHHQSQLQVASGGRETISNRVEQFYTLCPTAADQLPTLLKLITHDQLIHGSRSKVIVFCPTAQTVELFATLLRPLVEKVLPGHNTEIMRMHWQMKQSERNQVRLLFSEGGKTQKARPTVLVTSDISARATSYPGLTSTIQIGVPSKENMYIYQIGRMTRDAGRFIPGKGNRPTMRADLLLLPWEAGYMNWQLSTLPIKPLPISVLDDRLISLSPSSPVLTTELLQSVAEIQRGIDPAEVRRTAASLLGYYLPLSPPLRLQPRNVLAGVSSWASECFNVSIPAITRFPRKFTEAYEQSLQLGKTKGLFVDGLKLAGPTFLGKAKSKNRSVWEGANTRMRKPKRWY